LILGLSNISSPSDAILIYAIDNATFRGKRLHKKIPQKSNYTYKLESLYFIVHTWKGKHHNNKETLKKIHRSCHAAL
jgi:hypothetical protein